MKTPPFDHKTWWERLVRQARNDPTPPIDLPRLLRAVREAAPAPRRSWAADFSTLFATSRVMPACLACAGILTAIATWQVWDYWRMLAWAQWLSSASGGVL